MWIIKIKNDGQNEIDDFQYQPVFQEETLDNGAGWRYYGSRVVR